MSFCIEQVDLLQPHRVVAVVDLIDHYARQPMGRGGPLSEEVKSRLVEELPKQRNARIFMAFDQELPIGVAVCFLGFSTFRAKPVLNIHDLAVHVDFQGKGIGTKLLESVREFAKAEGCGSVTLEVRVDNFIARKLYSRFGFTKLDDPIASDAELFGRLALD